MLDPIHLFKPKYAVEECLTELRRVLESGWTAAGEETEAFEREWCSYTQLPYAHFVSSATAGLHLALEVLLKPEPSYGGEVQHGPIEVITSPLTFVSTNHAILHAGLKPVFADIDQHLCLSASSIERVASRHTRAVLFVGMGGNPGALREVSRLCTDRGWKLILDAAHMAGTYIGHEHVGAECTASVFSFQTVKNLPTGDGGMVCLPSLHHDQLARRLAWCGIDKSTHARAQDKSKYKWRYDVERAGWKYHGNAIAAAIGRVQLAHLSADNACRRMLAKEYDATLNSAFERIPQPAGVVSSRHLYQVLLPPRWDRELVISLLNEQGVFPGVHYWLNTHYPMYRSRVGASEPLAYATQIENRLLSLPLHCHMTTEHVARVKGALDQVLLAMDHGRL